MQWKHSIYKIWGSKTIAVLTGKKKCTRLSPTVEFHSEYNLDSEVGWLLKIFSNFPLSSYSHSAIPSDMYPDMYSLLMYPDYTGYISKELTHLIFLIRPLHKYIKFVN